MDVTQNSNAQVDLGILTCDGVGKVKASLAQDQAGKVTVIKANGRYSVAADGSGSLTMTNQHGLHYVPSRSIPRAKGTQRIKAVSGGSVQSAPPLRNKNSPEVEEQDAGRIGRAWTGFMKG